MRAYFPPVCLGQCRQQHLSTFTTRFSSVICDQTYRRTHTTDRNHIANAILFPFEMECVPNRRIPMRAHTKTGPSTSRDSWRCCRPLQQQPLPPPPFKPKQKHINQSFYSHSANNKIIIIINMNFILFICFALIHVSCPPKLRYQVEQTNTNGV